VQPRQILKGATYVVTRRCTQRQFFLRPSRRCRQAFLYCLAYAAQRTGVVIHAVIVMSNHYHLVVTDPEGVLPLFVECLNKLVAKCMNAHHGRWENFWSSEPASYVRLLDHQTVIKKIAYVLCNPVEAGLVKRGDEWPGLRLGVPGTYQVKRPNWFFRVEGEMPERISLELAPPPIEGISSARDIQQRMDEAVAEREQALRDRIQQQGRTFLGARAVLRQDPFASPDTLARHRKLSPRVASRNKWLRMETLSRCAEFIRDHRDALLAWRAGVRDVLFPAGTYLMRCHHQVRCAEA
jgi:REP element-mobilizing transposase RayT